MPILPATPPSAVPETPPPVPVPAPVPPPVPVSAPPPPGIDAGAMRAAVALPYGYSTAATAPANAAPGGIEFLPLIAIGALLLVFVLRGR